MDYFSCVPFCLRSLGLFDRCAVNCLSTKHEVVDTKLKRKGKINRFDFWSQIISRSGLRSIYTGLFLFLVAAINKPDGEIFPVGSDYFLPSPLQSSSCPFFFLTSPVQYVAPTPLQAHMLLLSLKRFVGLCNPHKACK